jgi:hypothetical protein
MSAVGNIVYGVGGVFVLLQQAVPVRGPAFQIASKQIASISDCEGYINSNVALSALSGHVSGSQSCI